LGPGSDGATLRWGRSLGYSLLGLFAENRLGTTPFIGILVRWSGARLGLYPHVDWFDWELDVGWNHLRFSIGDKFPLKPHFFLILFNFFPPTLSVRKGVWAGYTMRGEVGHARWHWREQVVRRCDGQARRGTRAQRAQPRFGSPVRTG
jgi:hypothetical protein